MNNSFIKNISKTMPSEKNIICTPNVLRASLLCAYEIKIVKVLPEGLFLYFDAGMTEEY